MSREVIILTSIKKYYRINAGENMFECTQIACEETIRDLKKVDYLTQIFLI